jgi:uroporphyrinogen decarboxylase
MDTLTSRERISRILRHEPVDRIGLYEHFWGDTRQKWTDDGFIKDEDDLNSHFDLDVRQMSPFNMVVDLDFEKQLLEETEDTELFGSSVKSVGRISSHSLPHQDNYLA